jgi:hypothetical protein
MADLTLPADAKTVILGKKCDNQTTERNNSMV